MNARAKNLEKIFLIAIFTTFMGQIYLSPFGTTFRLTFAVVVLNLLMLTFTEIKPIPTINLVGFLMFVVRSAVYVFNNDASLFDAFAIYYPILFFYIFYSIFFTTLDVRSFIKSPMALFLSIWICDSIPNVIEVIVRREWQTANFELVIYTIILIGLFRTLFTLILLYVSRYYYGLVRERENHHKFVERILLMSNLKSEMFFLRKSKKDIEDAMTRSFQIYEEIEDPKVKEALLAVTKDIHEIKKDYTRVITGIEKSIKDTPKFSMSIHEIFNIVVDANKKQAQSQKLLINFKSIVNEDFHTKEYFALISIINNIVTNAIDAIKGTGVIGIQEELKDEMFHLRIFNDGQGIEENDIQLIFEPGFSTKFNEINGIMASGIGLTHVKHLVESYLEGTITVSSIQDEYTTFDIMIPIDRLKS